jgi:hypothetical protein
MNIDENSASEREPDEPEPNDGDLEIRQMKVQEIRAYKRLVSLPIRWVNAFNEIEGLLPKTWLDWSNTSLHLQEMWWYTRNHPWMSCIFIDFQLVMDIRHKGQITPRIPARSFTTANGDLHQLYGSVANRLETHKVTFLMARGSTEGGSLNHFFAVVFDYDFERACIYGNEIGASSQYHELFGGSHTWIDWAGPWLWEVIGRQLGWIHEEQEEPVFFDGIRLMYTNWPQVGCNNHFTTNQIGS